MDSLLHILIFSWAKTIHHRFEVDVIAESLKTSVHVLEPNAKDLKGPPALGLNTMLPLI